MKIKKYPYFLGAFLFLASLSQVSHAIIITNYTAFFDDGSRLVVDLKGYDYGKGSHYASPINFQDYASDYPYTEAFDTFFYPSMALQKKAPVFPVKMKIGTGVQLGDGLYLEVDKYYGVSMNSFDYFFFTDEWLINSQVVYLYPDYYVTNFSGGFFKTYISPYDVSEPSFWALLIVGTAGMAWARKRKRTQYRHFLRSALGFYKRDSCLAWK